MSQQRPKPFTIAEIQKILDGFRSNNYYSSYHDFVFFLLGVGCRPGEAAGLRWQCVANVCTTVHFCRSITRGLESSTKNKKERTIDVSPAIVVMLKARRAATKPKPNDLIFTTPTGLSIDDRNFRRRAWTQVLKAAGVISGLV
jgi:integrase